MRPRTRRLLLGLVLTLTAAAIVLLILLKGPLAPLTVEVTSPQRGDLHPTLFGIGTVEARYSWDIGPQSTGRLVELYVDHGDRVQQGQLLGRMDPVDLPARLQAAALVADKQERLLKAAVEAVRAARERLDLARREAERYRQLSGRGEVSRESADQRDSTARTRAAELAAAQEKEAAARHDHQRALADLRALRARLDALDLRAPAAALVVERMVEPGSVVAASAAVLRLVDPATLWIRARIEQRGSSGLAVDLPALIELRQAPRRTLPGRVVRIELVADQLTEERWVDVAFEHPPDGLAVGSLADVTIQLPAAQKAYWLPSAAIQDHAGRQGVWLVRNGHAHFHRVEVGVRTLDGKAQILSALPQGVRVIVHAPAPLHEDQRVSVATR